MYLELTTLMSRSKSHEGSEFRMKSSSIHPPHDFYNMGNTVVAPPFLARSADLRHQKAPH